MVSLVDLVALYAGEVDDGGVELTHPCPTLELAVELCRTVNPATLAELVQAVYGDLPQDGIDELQLTFLGRGFERWRRRPPGRL